MTYASINKELSFKFALVFCLSFARERAKGRHQGLLFLTLC